MRAKCFLSVLSIITGLAVYSYAQEIERWDKTSSGTEHANIQWFKDAKFGLFIHWGLFSEAGGEWNGKNYYGISEWLMNRAKIPVKEYSRLAGTFNPQGFNASEWVKLAQTFGARYMVVTAKHHEGFAMFKSQVSGFNIVDASPYHQDPMKALATAAQKAGLKFGFYYSQFVDWHEPNGGRNNWDFNEAAKNYQQYYQSKSIPQIKELLSNYGPIDLLWFDQPGGQTKQQTQAMIDTVRKLQPGTLLSSRVGNGLGDFKDFGDGEVPAMPVKGAWEALFTHNDSWGYSKFDYNFKTSAEIIRLLATVASKGGNLILNVGPDGNGKFPEYSVRYLTQVGNWLKQNGESIYGTTAGLIDPQPWGVTTKKPGKLYLHIFNKPADGLITVPGINGYVVSAHLLNSKLALLVTQNGIDAVIHFSSQSLETDQVIVINYKGVLKSNDKTSPAVISRQYPAYNLEASYATLFGSARADAIVSANYFGDWKHQTCIYNMVSAADSALFKIRITQPGDYKINLEYSCDDKSAGQQGSLALNGKTYNFQTLRTSEYDHSKPMLFIKHTIAISTITKTGTYSLTIKPSPQNTADLFKLKTIVIEPVN